MKIAAANDYPLRCRWRQISSLPSSSPFRYSYLLMFTTKAYARLLLHYLRPQRGRVALLALFVGGAITLQLINPQFVRRFLDASESGRSLDELLRTAGLFVFVALVAQALKLAGTYLGENVAWTATNELRADLALHCLQLDMAFHKQHKPGELIERVDCDVNQLATFFSRLVIELGSNLLLLGGVVVLLWLVDWRVGLTMSVLATAVLLALRWLNRHVVPRWQAVRQVESDLFGYLEEWIGGTREIQSSGAAPYVLRRLYGLLRRRWHSQQTAMRFNIYVMTLPLALPTLAYVAAYLWGYRLFQNAALSVGSVYLIFYYVDVLKDPLWGIQRQVQDLQRAAASLNRIIALFARQPALDAGGTRSLPPGALGVACDHVSFHYADDPASPVLCDVDFTLAPGRILGLLGRTGSGKTTLTRLLLRFYDPTAGAIRLCDGAGQAVDLREVQRDLLRQGVGMVTQEVQLFHASVRDNLTLFDDAVDDARILAALDELGLRPWLDALPAGLDTPLPGGDDVSAGEAQLLALGRVFLADAGLLILDEASSRLDPATEQLLEKALTRLLAGRTAIIIAHRLATVRRADEIMILAGGRVVEHAERAALVADPTSRFARLLHVGLEEALA